MIIPKGKVRREGRRVYYEVACEVSEHQAHIVSAVLGKDAPFYGQRDGKRVPRYTGLEGKTYFLTRHNWEYLEGEFKSMESYAHSFMTDELKNSLKCLSTEIYAELIYNTHYHHTHFLKYSMGEHPNVVKKVSLCFAWSFGNRGYKFWEEVSMAVRYPTSGVNPALMSPKYGGSQAPKISNEDTITKLRGMVRQLDDEVKGLKRTLRLLNSEIDQKDELIKNLKAPRPEVKGAVRRVARV